MEEKTFYRVAPSSSLILRDEGGEPTLEGQLVPYGEWLEVDSLLEGNFMERFMPGSLRKTFSEGIQRMKGFYHHGRSRMFENAPIMDIKEVWETDSAAFFRATLLDGIPGFIVDGIRKGLYGASIGAKPVQMERSRWPAKSAYNPKGIEERTYRELRANEISLTPTPIYETSTVMLRAITDELAVEQMVKEPEKLLHLLRETQEAEPPHSQPEEPEAPVEPEAPQEPEVPQEPDPEPEGSRDTRHVKDYLADESEDTWRI